METLKGLTDELAVSLESNLNKIFKMCDKHSLYDDPDDLIYHLLTAAQVDVDDWEDIIFTKLSNAKKTNRLGRLLEVTARFPNIKNENRVLLNEVCERVLYAFDCSIYSYGIKHQDFYSILAREGAHLAFSRGMLEIEPATQEWIEKRKNNK